MVIYISPLTGVTFDESGVRVTLFGNEILSFSWADVLKIEEASRSIAVSYAVTLKNGKRISFDRRKKTRMAFERYRPDALVKKARGLVSKPEKMRRLDHEVKGAQGFSSIFPRPNDFF